jgi:hypothetical protein
VFEASMECGCVIAIYSMQKSHGKKETSCNMPAMPNGQVSATGKSNSLIEKRLKK